MKTTKKNTSKSDASADTLEILIQLKGDEVTRFKQALGASMWGSRSRVNAVFARHLLFERLTQMEDQRQRA